MPIQTKLITIRVPQNLLKTIDEFTISKELTRTNYILTLIRHDFKKRNIIHEKAKVRNSDGFLNGIFMGNIEDMPL